MAWTPSGSLTCLSGDVPSRRCAGREVVPPARHGGCCQRCRAVEPSVRALTFRALTDGLRSLDREGGEVDVPAELRVDLGALDAGAVDKRELLARKRDDPAVLADLEVDVAPRLLAS